MKGMIFDLDGTLLDSMGVWESVDRTFFARREIPYPEDYGMAVAGMDFRGTAVYTIDRFGLQNKPEELMAEWNLLAEEAYRTVVPLKPGARELLTALRAEGVRLGIATASNPLLLQAALEQHGLTDFFDAIALVEEVPRGKEFPDVYECCAQRMGVLPQDCAVVEDMAIGIRGANQGNFFTIGIADDYSAEAVDDLKSAADLFVESFWELSAHWQSGDCAEFDKSRKKD